MGASTCSGPLKSGTKREGADANVGKVVLAQSFAFTQSDTAQASGVYIPANAEIIDVQVKITTACDGASQNLSVGTSVTANELFSALALGTAADTIFFGSAGTITDADTWEDVGAADVQLWFITSAGTAGVGTITVQYVQN